MHSVNFIGAGRVGQTLGKLWSLHRTVIIQAICNRTLASAQQAAAFIGSGTAYAEIAALPAANIYFITTSDQFIEKCAERLAHNPHLPEKSYVFHCSGALNSQVLDILKQKNCYVASLHPPTSFTDPAQAIALLKNQYWVFEGDEACFAVAEMLLKPCQAKLLKISAADKMLYHTGCVIANNYLTTLAYIAHLCFEKAGITAVPADRICQNLMQNALDHLATQPIEKALTGPIERGDIEVVTHHIGALGDQPLIEKIYKVMGLATLPLTHLTPEQKNAFIAILRND